MAINLTTAETNEYAKPLKKLLEVFYGLQLDKQNQRIDKPGGSFWKFSRFCVTQCGKQVLVLF